MRFRRPEWDVVMPEVLVRYWTAWNSAELDAVRSLRTTKPEYRFAIVCEIDHHHGRLRYRWDMRRGGRTLMEGLDIVTLDPGSGLIERVDGFFGHPTPIAGDRSGVPPDLR